MTNPVVAGAAWAYAVEAGTHALRLIGSGVFDRFPDLQLVIGHMGEGLPFWMPRIDNRYQVQIGPPGGSELALLPSKYLRRNFHVTTSGMNYEAPLRMTLDVLGTARVLFAADYPFEQAGKAVVALEAMPLEVGTKQAVFEDNCVRVFGLT
jgi:5-carboxyvanillate decarboxylase